MSSPEAARYKLTLSYRGTAYAGWQLQANAETVQGVVERALAELLGAPVRICGASRTDAGVHARGQVAHLTLPAPFPERGLVHGTNRRLPEDVRVLAAERVSAAFHAKKWAKSKLYSYRLIPCRVLSPLDAPFALRVDPKIDPALLAAAAEELPGLHDFTAFALEGSSHLDPHRRIDRAAWREDESGLLFEIEGEGFLRGMVRSLVGTMIEVGLGKRSPAEFAALLDGRSRGEAGPTAPAHGLVLERVRYPDRPREG